MEGILVGCDRKAEWLLPWWWEHYSAHNRYPVAFADFGMSDEARCWCASRGELFSLTSRSPKALSSSTRSLWEATFGAGIWTFRDAWLKKPAACLLTPFAHTCWIDLDCEIRGSLAPLFQFLSLADIALVSDPDHRAKNQQVDPSLAPDETPYNSGVIAFRQNAPILQQWAALSQTGAFVSDQEALSRAIHLQRPRLLDLPPIYNWFYPRGPNPQALIIHYLCGSKVELLKKYLTFKKI